LTHLCGDELTDTPQSPSTWKEVRVSPQVGRLEPLLAAQQNGRMASTRRRAGLSAGLAKLGLAAGDLGRGPKVTAEKAALVHWSIPLFTRRICRQGTLYNDFSRAVGINNEFYIPVTVFYFDNGHNA
jgi:hypothetical protein